MRLLLFFLFSICISDVLHAEVLFDEEGKVRNLEQGVPLIIYSTTFSREEGPVKQIISHILSIMTDGQVHLIHTLDNSRNASLSPEEKKITIQRLGPVILPEKIRAALQGFFLESGNWTLSSKSYVPRREKGVWLAELTLQYGAAEHHCYFSSVDDKNPALSEPAEQFLALLEHIMEYVLTNKPL
ncbi:MAG: hypothetical protein JW774_03765 [Candidatus Aureabacteria bacterium]|nr:hypothetical protein [Candidatus Auribacterota bacterium]